MKTIGVLALQGAFIEHVNHIEKLGHKAVEIQKKTSLKASMASFFLVEKALQSESS